MEDSGAKLKAAIRAYSVRAVEALSAGGWALPPLDLREWGWQPTGDGAFVFRGIEGAATLLLPLDMEPLHSLPEHAACVGALRGHAVIGPRLDSLVGSPAGLMRLDAADIPDRVLRAILREVEDVVFDEATFNRAAVDLIAWLTRSRASRTVIAPLAGVNAEGMSIATEKCWWIANEKCRSGGHPACVSPGWWRASSRPLRRKLGPLMVNTSAS